jgi:hypothetical protein
MSLVERCPTCGKLVACTFALHDCKPAKPIRRSVIKSDAPTALQNGAWVRVLTLSCGHTQQASASSFDRVPKTTICHRCTVPRP